MTDKLILIVEDEIKLAEILRDYLQQASYQTEIIGDGREVLSKFNAIKPDLVLLDLMLPGKDGISLCREIRQISPVPIFMLTAKVDEIDRLLGLELGADDYICKPYSPREVVAKVRAMFRRIEQFSVSIPSSGFEVDESRHQVSFDGKKCEITTIEFQLLATLSKDVGRIFSREQLMVNMYNDNRIVSDRTIDSHIKKLRKKLADYYSGYEFIHSVYGAGYRFEILEANS